MSNLPRHAPFLYCDCTVAEYGLLYMQLLIVAARAERPDRELRSSEPPDGGAEAPTGGWHVRVGSAGAAGTLGGGGSVAVHYCTVP